MANNIPFNIVAANQTALESIKHFGETELLGLWVKTKAPQRLRFRISRPGCFGVPGIFDQLGSSATRKTLRQNFWKGLAFSVSVFVGGVFALSMTLARLQQVR